MRITPKYRAWVKLINLVYNAKCANIDNGINSIKSYELENKKFDLNLDVITKDMVIIEHNGTGADVTDYDEFINYNKCNADMLDVVIKDLEKAGFTEEGEL